MIGAPTSVVAGDSTGVKTLTIKMDSPASSAQLDYTVEGQQLTAGGWPLLNGVPTNLDTLSRVVMASGVELLRRHLIIEFEVGVTDSAIRALFSSRQIQVLSVTKAGQFFIRTLDPGVTYAQYDSMVQSLRGTPEVLLAAPILYSGLEITLPGRYPGDHLARSKWFTASDSFWAMRAIRAPQAWGCETGDYGGEVVRVGILESYNLGGHPDINTSNPLQFNPSDLGLTSSIRSVATRDSQFQHAAMTTGLLSAAGDNAIGIAGVAWKTQLHQFALSTPGRRNSLPTA
jgi:hypothetical protein